MNLIWWHNLSHPKYYIFKIENVKRKDLNIKIREYRKEHGGLIYL